MKENEPTIVAVSSITKRIGKFPFTDAGAALAVDFLDEEGGALYKIIYYKHHPGTADEETLPRSEKLGEVSSNGTKRGN